MMNVTLPDWTYKPRLIPRSLSPAKRRFLKVYAASPGHLADAARRADVPRRTVYNWLQSDEEFSEIYVDIRETGIDFAMSKLLVQINEGNSRAIIFYLKTFAKHRFG